MGSFTLLTYNGEKKHEEHLAIESHVRAPLEIVVKERSLFIDLLHLLLSDLLIAQRKTVEA